MLKPLIINKPLNVTSMDVIRVLRRITGIKKIGHAGTLDPLATGVLIICYGKGTKQISSFMDMTKQYKAEINLSAFSETDDREGELTAVEIKKQPTLKDIENIIPQFIGTIEQMPPKYSALKVKGKRAYDLARQGKEVELQARQVTIDSIDILNYEWPLLTLDIVCGKGTYIRALARDVGTALDTGGYLTKLERSAIGSYTLDESFMLDDIEGIKNEISLDFSS
ncbi:tRNA pseudouridine(55) synthase TruB [bacterium]|jgi:tRNA pseudouridine55 synthase|nr:tRNA pseudouridine(55) synthase TruB [bacterium]MBT5015795.1 tRNA pseudouridine(55) synthase TruB [bacterium]